MVLWVHCSFRKPGGYGACLGETLTVIYSTECLAPNSRPTNRPVAMLPLLVILFIVSYGILTLLVFEQGKTIESQRGLIREMLKDSTQLAALKDKMARDDSKRAHEKASVPAEHKDADSNASAGTKRSDKETKPGKSTHSMKEAPGKPASDLEDVRRSTRVI